MRNKRLWVLVIAVAMVVAACSGGDYSDEPIRKPPVESQQPLQVPDPPPAEPVPAPPPAQTEEEPYDAVFYDNPGANPFIDTEDDARSTFALDVDTGSYTIARRYLQDGNLPDEDSVRVEEFVNYFDQDYRVPSIDEGLALSVDGGPTPFMQNQRNQVIRIGVQSGELSRKERANANLVFVVDTSGSMEREDRLGLVKESLELLLSSLGPDDTVAIVEYGSNARVVLDPTPVWEEGEILHAIDRLRAGGSTNAAAGLQHGYRLANEAFRPDGINRVILCSDGVANVGLATDAEGILDLIARDAERGIELTTVGFGMGNYNDVLMEQLADQGNGHYAYVDTLDEAWKIFVEDLNATLQTVAADARIQVQFDPRNVQSWRLVGFENRALEDDDFRDDTVDAGEIGAGHTVTALYEVKPNRDAFGDLGVVRLRWIDPATGGAREIEHAIHTEGLGHDFESTAPRFQLDVVVAQFAEVLRESVWAEQVGADLDDVAAWAAYVDRIVSGDRDVAEFAALTQRAAGIAG